jgi:hypothetical protein
VLEKKVSNTKNIRFYYFKSLIFLIMYLKKYSKIAIYSAKRKT